MAEKQTNQLQKLTGEAVRRIAGLEPFPLPSVVPLRHPLVLMHGFGLLAGVRRGGHYYDAAQYLRQRGVRAYAPNVSPYNTVARRADTWMERLDRVLDETKADKVNLVAHSMGGLDARYIISCRDCHDRVASLTTISTPHHGTYIATWILSQPERIRELLTKIADWFGANAVVDGEADFRTAIEELTPEHVHEVFNPGVEDHPDVAYFSYAGTAGRGTDVAINPFLRMANSILYESEGVNDGLVSTKSAQWGHYLGPVKADHALQVGLQLGSSQRFNANEFYLRHVELLVGEGF